MTSTLKNALNLGPVRLVGLDVGSSSVKVVQMKKDERGYAAVAATMVSIDTETEDPQQLRENTISAIGKCLEAAAFQTRNAVCGLCGPDVMVRGFNFPQLPPEAIEQAVLLEAQQVCPLVNHTITDVKRADLLCFKPCCSKHSRSALLTSVIVWLTTR